MKKETLEEVAEKESEYLADWEDKEMYKRGFKDGAKWQQERSYSEEEVILLLQKYRYDLSSNKTSNLGDTTEKWLEKNK